MSWSVPRIWRRDVVRCSRATLQCSQTDDLRHSDPEELGTCGVSWAVPRIWPGEPVVILGTGPSLDREQVEVCVGYANIIAIGSSYAFVPESERPHAWLHGCDPDFWEEWPDARYWPGIKTTLTPGPYDAHLLVGNGEFGLSDDPRYVKTGGQSSYQAVNIAYHAGGRPIILLGCDCKFGSDGRTHHTEQQRPGPTKQTFTYWLGAWKTIVPPLSAAGVPLINATPDTAIPETTITRMDLLEALSLQGSSI